MPIVSRMTQTFRRFATGLLIQSVFGAGNCYGTSVVVMRSAKLLVAAVDSRESLIRYGAVGSEAGFGGLARSAQTAVDTRTSCKVAAAGPYYAVVAGLARVSVGLTSNSSGAADFDALREAALAWRQGDTLYELAERVKSSIPRLLTPILQAIREADPAGFARRYAAQPVLQLTFVGLERTAQGRSEPAVAMVEFAADGGARSTSCPGDCTGPASAWFLGTHERIDEFLRVTPARRAAFIGNPGERQAETLVNLEAAASPDLVGGPVSIVRVDGSGAELVRPGACAGSAGLASGSRADGSEKGKAPEKGKDSALPNVPGAALDRTLSDLGRVIVRENIVRFAASGSRVRRLDSFETMAEVLDGVEHYQSLSRDGKPESLTSGPGTGLWSFGELATLLRTTRDALGGGDARGSNGGDLVFHFPETSRRWYVIVDSRVYWLAFEGRVWMSPETGGLSRVSWMSSALPPATGLERVEWTVDFRATEIAGKSFTLPSSATYRILRTPIGRTDASRVEWNVTTFSDYVRYGSNSVLLPSE